MTTIAIPQEVVTIDQSVLNPTKGTYGLTILLALNNMNRHIYTGTVSVQEKLARRARGKRARLARKAHR